VHTSPARQVPLRGHPTSCLSPFLFFLLQAARKAERRHAAELEAAETYDVEVRFSCRFSPTGDLGYRRIRGAVGLGYRFTV
jgi:hypothetical protein